MPAVSSGAARGRGGAEGGDGTAGTVVVTAPSCWSPSRYQTMVAAGLALRARHVRLYGVPARSRISGAPSMVGSSGGTAEGTGDQLGTPGTLRTRGTLHTCQAEELKP